VNTDWKTQLVSLTQLRSKAAIWSHDIGAFEFLHQEGVVPHEVLTMPAEKVRLGFNAEAVPAGYLASAAYEWDTWGPSHPEDFIEAMECELRPEKRDLIAGILTALGRSTNEGSSG
jgi:hypothetical protein